MTDLDQLRHQILEIDEALLKLWHDRDEAARQVGELKHSRDLPLQNFEVEKAVLEHALATAGKLGLSAERVRTFVRLLIESALAVQERERVRRVGRSGRKALVLGGSGLMGTWFARFLEEQGFAVFVQDPNPSPYPGGRLGSDSFDIVVLATPPSTVPALLEEVGRLVDGKTLVFDIASVKGKSQKVLEGLARGGKKVASLHPLFGPSTELLMGRNVLVLDCGSEAAVREAKALFGHTAARVFEIPIGIHDELMAEVLGLSHATNIAFNAALSTGKFSYLQLEPFASTTFRKQVDVAREVAKENPRLYYEIQTLNEENLKVLRRLETVVSTLRTIVERRDRLAFVDLMHRAHAYFEGGSERLRS